MDEQWTPETGDAHVTLPKGWKAETHDNSWDRANEEAYLLRSITRAWFAVTLISAGVLGLIIWAIVTITLHVVHGS